ncbi:hypothetical protein SK128_009328 [Halocaridina rubra]|uniref:Uncharacterized protein n=1 Tax=Halocaridina rubra TaxID=373956 RepID=A0AAN8X5D1_HALRR
MEVDYYTNAINFSMGVCFGSATPFTRCNAPLLYREMSTRTPRINIQQSARLGSILFCYMKNVLELVYQTYHWLTTCSISWLTGSNGLRNLCKDEWATSKLTHLSHSRISISISKLSKAAVRSYLANVTPFMAESCALWHHNLRVSETL